MLNYGYAVVRSVISKYLTAYGLLPSFGIHHKSVTNAFNLSDDIIESYRPLIDGYIFDYIIQHGEATEFNKHAKAYIVAILEKKILIDEKSYNLLMALDISCQSLMRCFKANSVKHLS